MNNDIINIISVIIIIFLIYLCYKCTKQIYGKHIEAVVLNTKKDSDVYILTVKYKIDDKEYINKITSKKKILKESKISIIYNSKDPNQIELGNLDLTIDRASLGTNQLFAYLSIGFIPLFIIITIGYIIHYVMV